MNTPDLHATRAEIRKRRITAQLKGLTHYKAVLPCPGGHVDRYASNGKCAPCQIQGALGRYHQRGLQS